jgi:hypothetical protein
MKTFEHWHVQSCPQSEFRYSGAAFSIDRVELSSERANNSESKLRLIGAGRRRNDDGSFVVERVTATLLGRDGGLVRVQRFHDDDSPLAVGAQTAWSHQAYDAELATTHAVHYVVETRLVTSRVLMTCQLGEPDLFAETATWPILGKDIVANDLVSIDVAVGLRRGKRADISVLAETDITYRNFNLAFEFYFVDKHGVAVATAATSRSLENGFASERASAGIERVGATIASLVIRARIEASIISELGPIALPDACRPAR